jgi:CRISPR-associated endonuclease/helicase Cas3
MNKEFIAHRREKDGEAQSLRSHLLRTAVYCGQFAEKIGLKDAGRVIGLFHDLGKASNEFDNYIQSATGRINPDADGWVDAKAKKGKIDHSSAGAQFIFRTLSKQGAAGINAAQLLALCIASHHSGIIDCLLPSGEDNFTRRINKKTEKTHIDEALSYFQEEEKQKITEMLSSENHVKQIIEKVKSLKEDGDKQDTALFKYGLLARFLFSCLIDADRLNTADFEFPRNAEIRNYGKYCSWDVLIERLNAKIKEFENKPDKNEVDDLRNEVSEQCFNFSTKPKGIYQLTVPTGGGKTMASLRFALNHAKHHKLDRIFYVIPFTSIIDQNADELRKILEDKDSSGKYLDRVVLEHHSNLTPDEETKRQTLLSENWDAPIVFTTQVQFLETMFGSGTRSARRMHQLANSVIIFDEVQTIPVRCVHMFNVSLRFLVNNCGASVILCTATQPLLDKASWLEKKIDDDSAHRFLNISSGQRIIQDEHKLFKKLQRVKVYDKRKKTDGWSENETADLVKKEVNDAGSVLIIVNKKDSARLLYETLKGKNTPDIYHLSTNMCPAHRLEVLYLIKDRIEKKLPVVCVSTQLIEAGVDIDFGTVIRYLAGLDSITQAAGRCNRNGRRKTGKVYIINPCNKSLDKLKDIKTGADNAERVLREYKKAPKTFDNDRIGLKAMKQFYTYYFYDRHQEMCYPVNSKSTIERDDNLFNLLSMNSVSCKQYEDLNHINYPLPLRHSFQSAAKAFHAIDSPTRGVIVPYGKAGERIVNDLCDAVMLEKQYKLLKTAQRFSVNLYPYEFEEMEKKQVIRPVQNGADIYYMNYQYYSNEFGWSKEIVTEMKSLNF